VAPDLAAAVDWLLKDLNQVRGITLETRQEIKMEES
jgi:hypothetical protein